MVHWLQISILGMDAFVVGRRPGTSVELVFPKGEVHALDEMSSLLACRMNAFVLDVF